MTPGEKQLWREMFAKRYHDMAYSDLFEHRLGATTTQRARKKMRKMLLQDAMLHAVDCATVFVLDARNKKFHRAVREKFGKDSDAYKMLKEVLEENK